MPKKKQQEKATPAEKSAAQKNPQEGAPVAHCKFTRWVEAATLRPYPQNAQGHPEEQLKRLGANIKELGWRAPIAVSLRSGFVVRGHGRLAAALLAGWTHVPVDFQDYASDEAERADRIADNRLNELAVLDSDKLKEELLALDAVDFDLAFAGFTEEEAAKLFEEAAAPEDFAEKGETISTEHECPKCGYRWSGKSGGAEEPDGTEEEKD